MDSQWNLINQRYHFLVHANNTSIKIECPGDHAIEAVMQYCAQQLEYQSYSYYADNYIIGDCVAVEELYDKTLRIVEHLL